MFGKYRQRVERLNARIAALEAAGQELAKHAILVGIERNGRSNIFKFMKGEEVFQIETMGLLSDDVAQWRKDLLP